MTEAELLEAVVDCAHLFGWRVAHFRPARTGQGWRTAVAADGAGFPDLVLARVGEVIFAELKSARGRLSDAQVDWVGALGGGCCPVAVWRPEDWASGEIEACLRR